MYSVITDQLLFYFHNETGVGALFWGGVSNWEMEVVCLSWPTCLRIQEKSMW